MKQYLSPRINQLVFRLFGLCSFSILLGLTPILVSAASSVSITVDTTTAGNVVRDEFVGLSFEVGSIRSGNAGVSGYLFDTLNSPTNDQVLNLFQQIGVRHLRIGGGSVDSPSVNPSHSDIDALFRFAGALDLPVTYSLRLLNGNATNDASDAKYVWDNYSSLVDNFAIGNEPDWHFYHTSDPLIYETTSGVPGTAYPSYWSDWKNFVTTITGTGGAPGAAFVGPDTGSNYPVVNNPPFSYLSNATDTSISGVTWTTKFASDANSWSFPNSSSFDYALFHNYPGQSASGKTVQQMVDAMLSDHWVTADYPDLYDASGAPAMPSGVSYRITETNPFTEKVSGGSNSFATALWALDYMHWWAAANTITGHSTLTRGCLGVNFHNKQWGENNVIYQVSTTDYEVYPIGYGLKAFGLGGHGYVMPCSITSNVDGVNLTAYAVGNALETVVTIVNKEHGGGSPKDAAITLTLTGFTAASAQWMELAGGTGGGSSTSATLGGASISNSSQNLGTWTQLTLNGSGQPTVTIPATRAGILRIRNAGNYVGPTQINQGGTLQIFGTGSNGDTWRRQQSTAGDSSASNWSSWTDMGGGVNSSGSTAVAKELDTRLSIFVSATSPNTNVYWKKQTSPGGGFTSWEDLGGSGIGSLQVARNPDGSLHLFGLDSSGNLKHNTQNAPDGFWSGWSTISGKTLQPGFTVTNHKDGRIVVIGLATGTSPHVWNIWQQAPGGSWGGWTDMGSQITDPYLRSAINLDGRIAVFGIASSGHVYRSWQPTSGGWSGFTDIGTKSIEPGFAVAQNKDGRFVLLGVDANSPGHLFNVWESAVNGDSTWTGWTDMSLPSGVTIDGQITAGSTSDHRIQLFAIGSDGHVWSNWQESSGGWNGWSDFGNTGGVVFYDGQ